MSIKKMPNYNTGIDLLMISVAEATYILNSFIEESINDIHTRCLLVDRRSLNESGVLYFTEENDTGKQKLGDKIKQIVKTVWDVIVGIFKKIRDFFKDMIEKLKEFFSKIQKKIFGKKKKEEAKVAEKPADKKEEPKFAEKPVEKKDDSKPEEKAAEKKEEPKKRPFNTEKISTIQDEDGISQVDQKELVRYMRDLPDNVFRESVDKNITKYYDTEAFLKKSELLSGVAFDLNKYGNDEDDYASGARDRVRKFLSNPLPEVTNQSISRGMILDCAFGNYSIYYKDVDKNFKYVEKTFDNLSKNSDKLEPQFLPLVKDLLKLTTECSKKYSSVMIHNTKELMKVVHYIYNNYDRDGVSVKESVDWSSIL